MADVIDPDAVAVPAAKLEQVGAAGRLLVSNAEAIGLGSRAIDMGWQNLAPHYEAPESGQLLSATRMVRDKGSAIEDNVRTVGRALQHFAIDAEAPLQRIRALRQDARDLRGRIDEAGDDWRKDGDLVDEHNQLNDDILAALVEYQEHERTCANKITGIFGGTTFIARDPDGSTKAGNGEEFYGLSRAVEGRENAWGAPQRQDRPLAIEIGRGAWDFGGAVVTGGAGMLGLHGQEDGWVGWGDVGTSLLPFTDGGKVQANFEENWGAAATGAAGLAGLHNQKNGWAWKGGWSWSKIAGNAKTNWKETAHGFVPWREWDEGRNAGYVITQGVLNIGSAGTGGVTTVKGLARHLGNNGHHADLDLGDPGNSQLPTFDGQRIQLPDTDVADRIIGGTPDGDTTNTPHATPDNHSGSGNGGDTDTHHGSTDRHHNNDSRDGDTPPDTHTNRDTETRTDHDSDVPPPREGRDNSDTSRDDSDDGADRDGGDRGTGGDGQTGRTRGTDTTVSDSANVTDGSAESPQAGPTPHGDNGDAASQDRTPRDSDTTPNSDSTSDGDGTPDGEATPVRSASTDGSPTATPESTPDGGSEPDGPRGHGDGGETQRDLTDTATTTATDAAQASSAASTIAAGHALRSNLEVSGDGHAARTHGIRRPIREGERSPDSPDRRDIPPEHFGDVDPTRPGSLGDRFTPGIYDPTGDFDPVRERPLAELHAAEGNLVTRVAAAGDGLTGRKSIDTLVRTGPDDPGTLVEYKNVDENIPGDVCARVMWTLEKFETNKDGSYLEGDASIDGRRAADQDTGETTGVSERNALDGLKRGTKISLRHHGPRIERVGRIEVEVDGDTKLVFRDGQISRVTEAGEEIIRQWDSGSKSWTGDSVYRSPQREAIDGDARRFTDALQRGDLPSAVRAAGDVARHADALYLEHRQRFQEAQDNTNAVPEPPEVAADYRAGMRADNDVHGQLTERFNELANDGGLADALDDFGRADLRETWNYLDGRLRETMLRHASPDTVSRLKKDGLYKDPDFDVNWLDRWMGRMTGFQVSRTGFHDPRIRIRNPGDHGIFLDTGDGGGPIGPRDIAQGRVADCGTMSLLASVAQQNPALIRNMLTANPNGTYTLALPDGRSATVTADLPLGMQGKPMGARYGQPDPNRPGVEDIWPAIFEKAYAEILGGKYSSLEFRFLEAHHDITGRPPDQIATEKVDLADLAERHARGDAIAVGTVHRPTMDMGENKRFDALKLLPHHAYYVTDVDPHDGTITLRNPHGPRTPDCQLDKHDFQQFTNDVYATPLSDNSPQVQHDQSHSNQPRNNEPTGDRPRGNGPNDGGDGGTRNGQDGRPHNGPDVSGQEDPGGESGTERASSAHTPDESENARKLREIEEAAQRVTEQRSDLPAALQTALHADEHLRHTLTTPVPSSSSVVEIDRYHRAARRFATAAHNRLLEELHDLAHAGRLTDTLAGLDGGELTTLWDYHHGRLRETMLQHASRETITRLPQDSDNPTRTTDGPDSPGLPHREPRDLDAVDSDDGAPTPVGGPARGTTTPAPTRVPGNIGHVDSDGVRRFDTDDSGDAYGRAVWSDAGRYLSERQLDAFRFYTGVGSLDINDALRGTPSGPDLSADLANKITMIDRAVATRRVPEDIAAVRGTGVDAFRLPDGSIPDLDNPEHRTALEGTSQGDSGFLSTSLGKNPSHPDHDVWLHLDVPEGTPAIYTPEVNGWATERELLLGRGASYTVGRVTFEDGTWLVHARVEPGGGRPGNDPDDIPDTDEPTGDGPRSDGPNDGGDGGTRDGHDGGPHDGPGVSGQKDPGGDSASERDSVAHTPDDSDYEAPERVIAETPRRFDDALRREDLRSALHVANDADDLVRLIDDNPGQAASSTAEMHQELRTLRDFHDAVPNRLHEAFLERTNDGRLAGALDTFERRDLYRAWNYRDGILRETILRHASRETITTLKQTPFFREPRFDVADPEDGIGRVRIEEPDAHDIFTDPRDGSGPISHRDIAQGAVGDGNIMATLASVAGRAPELIRDMLTSNGNGTYTLQLPDGRSATVTADLPVNRHGEPLGAGFGQPDPTCPEGRDIWPAIVEKAYAKILDRDYSFLEIWPPHEATRDIVGRVGYDKLSRDTDVADMARWHDRGDAILVGTPHWHSIAHQGLTDDFHASGLVPDHAYYVTDADPRTDTITLRNPAGPHTSDIQISEHGLQRLTKFVYSTPLRELSPHELLQEPNQPVFMPGLDSHGDNPGGSGGASEDGHTTAHTDAPTVDPDSTPEVDGDALHGAPRTDLAPQRLEPHQIPPPFTSGIPREAAPLNSRYSGEDQPGSPVWGPDSDGVRYLGEQERERYRLVASDGRLFTTDGERFDTSVGRHGRAIYVVDEYGNLYASNFQAEGRFHHSSLLAGAPVAGAGEIRVDGGEVKLLTDKSGHYMPTPEHTRQVVNELFSMNIKEFDYDFVAETIRALHNLGELPRRETIPDPIRGALRFFEPPAGDSR